MLFVLRTAPIRSLQPANKKDRQSLGPTFSDETDMEYDAAKAQLVKRAADANRRQVATLLELGRLATVAIRARLRSVPGEVRHVERARTIADLRTAAGVPELARWIRCFGTAQAFDLDGAKTLTVNALRAFGPLVKRNARSESWTVKAKHRDFAGKLWQRAPTMSAPSRPRT